MTRPGSVVIAVDKANPGQFFACCGLLELADRLWPGAEGWFADGEFRIACEGELDTLVSAIADAEMELLDKDPYSGRVLIGKPFRPLCCDWWHELGGRSDARDLKVWAGSMESYGIARAMQLALADNRFHQRDLLDVGMIVPDADNLKNKKEPFYFDARRAANSHSRDVGFSANDLSLTTTAYPAVELLCLVGLQRALPRRAGRSRNYDYFTWSVPIGPPLVPAAVAGLLPLVSGRCYRFENWFRTGQRKHKSFRAAIPYAMEADSE